MWEVVIYLLEVLLALGLGTGALVFLVWVFDRL
jgi:hypothetical protein